MFCKKCGTELAEGISFCPKCGAEVTQTQTPVSDNSNQDFGSQTYSETAGSTGYGTAEPAKAAKPKGAVLLLVLGILCVIGGIITLVTSFVWFGQVSSLASYVSWIGIKLGSLWGYGVLVLVDGALLLIVGILSILWRAKSEKANLILICAIIVVILRIVDWVVGSAIVYNITSLTGTATTVVTPATVILGLIVPILLIIGAILNKKS